MVMVVGDKDRNHCTAIACERYLLVSKWNPHLRQRKCICTYTECNGGKRATGERMPGAVQEVAGTFAFANDWLP